MSTRVSYAESLLSARYAFRISISGGSPVRTSDTRRAMVVLSAGLLREAFAALSASFIYASSAALPVASGAELVGVMTGATNAQCLVYLPPCFTQAERIAPVSYTHLTLPTKRIV